MSTLTVSSSTLSTSQVQLTARGLIAETSNPAGCNSSGIPAAGNANGSLTLGLVGLPAGTVVTNIVCGVIVAAGSLTFAKMGLFSSTGTFLGATAEFSGTLNGATGFVQQPLSPGPVTVPTSAGYYLAFLQFGNSSTGATLLRGTSTSSLGVVEGVQLGAFARGHAVVATQTDISANIAIANASSTTIGIWLACS